MVKIQIIAIAISLLFLLYIIRLILKGKLREEYSIIWIACTLVLIVFSFWREGLEIMAEMLGVYEAPNLIFTGAIFAVLIYLLHLSVVVSRLHEQNKQLAQEIALLKNKVGKLKDLKLED
jgi:hypothetical protein